MAHFESLYASGWSYKAMKKAFKDLYKVGMTLHGIELDKWPRVFEFIKWTSKREAKVMAFTQTDLKAFFEAVDMSDAGAAVRAALAVCYIVAGNRPAQFADLTFKNVFQVCKS